MVTKNWGWGGGGVLIKNIFPLYIDTNNTKIKNPLGPQMSAAPKLFRINTAYLLRFFVILLSLVERYAESIDQSVIYF